MENSKWREAGIFSKLVSMSVFLLLILYAFGAVAETTLFEGASFINAEKEGFEFGLPDGGIMDWKMESYRDENLFFGIGRNLERGTSYYCHLVVAPSDYWLENAENAHQYLNSYIDWMQNQYGEMQTEEIEIHGHPAALTIYEDRREN